MIGRRTFPKTMGATAFGPTLLFAAESSDTRKHLAVVTTEWRYPSHAWHIAESDSAIALLAVVNSMA
jgi:hypothetical protein